MKAKKHQIDKVVDEGNDWLDALRPKKVIRGKKKKLKPVKRKKGKKVANEQVLRRALEVKLLGERALPKTSKTPKKKRKKKLKTQYGLTIQELWRLRKAIQRLFPITKKTKSQKSGKKGKLQRHHKDGNVRNTKKSNVQIVTEPEHVKIHQKEGTYSDAGKLKPKK